MIIKAPILIYYKQSFKTIVETDFFNYINSEVFFNLRENELLYLIVFFTKNMNPTEYNYEIYDKKLLAIIQCFKQ